MPYFLSFLFFNSAETAPLGQMLSENSTVPKNQKRPGTALGEIRNHAYDCRILRQMNYRHGSFAQSKNPCARRFSITLFCKAFRFGEGRMAPGGVTVCP